MIILKQSSSIFTFPVIELKQKLIPRNDPLFSDSLNITLNSFAQIMEQSEAKFKQMQGWGI